MIVGLNSLENWLNQTSLLGLGLVTLLLMLLAAVIGVMIRQWRRRSKPPAEGAGGDLEGLVVSAVLGLLALLMGFTFSLAVDRFETRRALVLEEANAIGTAYLRVQLLDAPHRERMSRLLVRYTDNRVVLGSASREQVKALLPENDQLLTDLWAATTAATPGIPQPGVVSVFLQSINTVIDLDAARKTARAVRVPAEVFAVLLAYLIGTAGVLGYVFVGKRGQEVAVFMLFLLMLSFLLILDIDRPTIGGVREDQTPIRQLRASLKAQPPAVFDRYRLEDARPAD